MNTRKFLQSSRSGLLTIAFALSVMAFGTLALAAGVSYFNGFDTNTYDWSGVTRVASGTNDILSATGGWHAEAAADAFTRWGGYGDTAGCSGSGCVAPFPPKGYVTSIDIYLDASSETRANDTRFDFSSAINDPTGAFHRDFVFNAGFYNDGGPYGSGARFVISASNNAGRGSSFPRNPGRYPVVIDTPGWYTFQHTFTDNGSGVLTVELAIKDSAGAPRGSWTLSDPSDIINVTVGGNRYGWFVQQEFSPLAIDNASKLNILSQPADKEQCKNDGWKFASNGDGAPFKNQGQCVKFITTGK